MSDEIMRDAWDGDSAESRTGFRDFDRDCEVRGMTAWQIWRHACAWQASRTVQNEVDAAKRVEPVAVRLECYAETQGEWFQVTERDAEHFKSCGCAVRALGVISDVTPAPVKPAESKS